MNFGPFLVTVSGECCRLLHELQGQCNHFPDKGAFSCNCLQVYIAESDKVANQVCPIYIIVLVCFSLAKSAPFVNRFFRMEKFSLGAFVEFLEQWKISGLVHSNTF